MIRHSFLALAIAATSASFADKALAQSAPPMPVEIKPTRVSGLGLTVSDLERSRKFYTDVLGLTVDAQVPAQGKPVELLLGMTGDTKADTLVVMRQGEVVPGAAKFGRIVIVVPDGRKLAERVAAAGFPPARIVDGTNIIKDPDGYVIELYQRPAPKP